jgi:5-hydroxyisourate hydrolase-like protein (transthyretin family)
VRFGSHSAVIVVCATSLWLCAQTAKPPAPAGRITGKVVHAVTGQPLADIDVAISPTEQHDLRIEVSTGSDGRFVFENVARGKFSLSAQGRGFSEQAYQQHAPYSTAIAVGPGLVSENLVFPLVPDASISGTVLDEENEAVRSGDVRLFARDAGTGRIELRAQANLQDQGRYHFGHLPPGTYFVAVSAQPWYAVDPQNPQNAAQLYTEAETQSYKNANAVAAPREDSALDVAFRITFYADAVDGESATPIQLHPGERATADITLRAVPAVHLVVRNASTDPNQPGSATIQQRVFNRTLVPILARTQPGAQGTLKLSGIPPGHAVVNLRSFSGKEWKNQVREVDVSTDSEIDAADSSSGTITVHGRVQNPAADAFAPGAYIRFFNRDTNETFGAPVSPKGEFEVRQTIGGTSDYEVAVINVRGFRVQRIAATGAKVSGRTLALPHSGSVELTVTMSEQAGRIDGTVLRDGKSLSQAMVVLVPEFLQGNADLIRRDQSDSDGTFSLYQVLPGRYRVVAIANGWELDWQNPAVLRPYLEHSEPIEVTAARTYKISVPAQDIAVSQSTHAQN